MTIGIDASRANRKQKTGVEWYSYYLIQELKNNPQKTGDKFILYSPDKLINKLGNLPLNWEFKQLSWPIRYVWTQIRMAIEMLFNSPDLLFVPAHALPFLSFTKSITTIHDIGFKRFSKHYSFWQRIYYSLAHKWSIKKACKIITPSNFTKKEIIKLYNVPENKIVVIPHGYNKDIYNNKKTQVDINLVLEKYKIKKPYFLYVGRLEKKKNVLGLLLAYKKFISNINKNKVPDLVLVGKPGYGYEQISNVINELKPGVHELGHVLTQDLGCLYNSAMGFVFPSFYEGFGIPVLEAMACACPVLASNISTIEEVGKDAILYFNSNDINSIIKSMKLIINNKELREKLINLGLKRVDDFSWEKCAKQTVEIFHTC